MLIGLAWTSNQTNYATLWLCLCRALPLFQHMPPKGKKHFVTTNEALEALLRSFNRNEDYHMVGRALGMSTRAIDQNILREWDNLGKETR